MPSEQSLAKQQYYGNPRNHFWSILGALLGQELPAQYEQRIALLQSANIGLWDVIQSCERKGSLDAAIRNEVPNDFEAMFARYPQITAILFNGGKSYDVFKKHIGFHVLQNRDYVKLPSTSPIPGKNIKTFEQKIDEWATLLKYIK